jgi:hypothetical protein
VIGSINRENAVCKIETIINIKRGWFSSTWMNFDLKSENIKPNKPKKITINPENHP